MKQMRKKNHKKTCRFSQRNEIFYEQITYNVFKYDFWKML